MSGKKKAVKTKTKEMTGADREYLDNHRDEPVTDLAHNTGLTLKQVTSFLATLGPAKKKSATERPLDKTHFGVRRPTDDHGNEKNNGASVVMTEAEAIRADEIAKANRDASRKAFYDTKLKGAVHIINPAAETK